jgi:hypothetical protein
MLIFMTRHRTVVSRLFMHLLEYDNWLALPKTFLPHPFYLSFHYGEHSLRK